MARVELDGVRVRRVRGHVPLPEHGTAYVVARGGDEECGFSDVPVRGGDLCKESRGVLVSTLVRVTSRRGQSAPVAA